MIGALDVTSSSFVEVLNEPRITVLAARTLIVSPATDCRGWVSYDVRRSPV